MVVFLSFITNPTTANLSASPDFQHNYIKGEEGEGEESLRPSLQCIVKCI